MSKEKKTIFGDNGKKLCECYENVDGNIMIETKISSISLNNLIAKAYSNKDTSKYHGK